MDPILGEGLVRGMQRPNDCPYDSHAVPNESVPS